MDKKIDNLKEARQNLKKCSEILQEYDMRFFMSDEESTIYLTTADKLLDKTVILLKQIINYIFFRNAIIYLWSKSS